MLFASSAPGCFALHSAKAADNFKLFSTATGSTSMETAYDEAQRSQLIHSHCLCQLCWPWTLIPNWSFVAVLDKARLLHQASTNPKDPPWNQHIWSSTTSYNSLGSVSLLANRVSARITLPWNTTLATIVSKPRQSDLLKTVLTLSNDDFELFGCLTGGAVPFCCILGDITAAGPPRATTQTSTTTPQGTVYDKKQKALSSHPQCVCGVSFCYSAYIITNCIAVLRPVSTQQQRQLSQMNDQYHCAEMRLELVTTLLAMAMIQDQEVQRAHSTPTLPAPLHSTTALDKSSPLEHNTWNMSILKGPLLHLEKVLNVAAPGIATFTSCRHLQSFHNDQDKPTLSYNTEQKEADQPGGAHIPAGMSTAPTVTANCSQTPQTKTRPGKVS